jgi:cell division protein FtsQ
MWDNASLLRSLAGSLFLCSVIAVLYGAGHYAVHRPELLPISTVRLNDVPQRVSADEVRDAVRQSVQGNFLTVDIDKVRHALEKLTWVRNVSVRREFPNTLAVQFEEHKALARWNDVALVNQQGEVFVAETTQLLPRFSGYEGTSMEVAQQYAKFSAQLEKLDLKVVQLALSPRQAWRLQLSNEMVVELGREAMGQRLARFVAVYPYSLATEAQLNAVVDMRYRNGFTVRRRHA